jgi:hypothetical protein
MISNLIKRLGNFHPASLPAASRMDLGFDHPATGSGLILDQPGGIDGSPGCLNHQPFGNGYPERTQQLLGLIFVEIHIDPDFAVNIDILGLKFAIFLFQSEIFIH